MKKLFSSFFVFVVLAIIALVANTTAYAAYSDQSFLVVTVAPDSPLGVVNKDPDTILAKFSIEAYEAKAAISYFMIGTNNLGLDLGDIKIKVDDKLFTTRFWKENGSAIILSQGGEFPLFTIPKGGIVTMTLIADTSNIPDGSLFAFTVLGISYQEDGRFNPEINKISGMPTSDPIILGQKLENNGSINSCSIIEQENTVLREKNNKLSVLAVRLLEVIDYLQRWIAMISPRGNAPSSLPYIQVI